MALFINADRVQETTATTGTGAISLAGAAAQCQTFINAVGDGNWCDYLILGGNGTDWESGMTIIHAGSPPTLSRDTPITSTNGGAKISLTGTSTVFLAPSHARAYSRHGRRSMRPTLTGFTWLNQGTASAVDYINGPLSLSVPAQAGDAVRGIIVAPPGSTPYTCTLELDCLLWGDPFFTAGICVVDSAGKMLTATMQVNMTAAYSKLSPFHVQVDRWTNTTTFNINEKSLPIMTLPRWFRVNNSGTTWTFSISPNGADWIVIYSEALTAFLGATISGLGLVVDNNDTGSVLLNSIVSLWSYELVTGAGNNVQWV